MEPLKDDTNNAVEEVKSKLLIERVILGKSEALKVGGWVRQLNESSRGFLQLTKSDVVNFLIRAASNDLSAKEISQLRADHYDPIRHLGWITPRLKDALLANDFEQMSVLQAEIRAIESAIASRADGVARNENGIKNGKQKKIKKEKTTPDAIGVNDAELLRDKDSNDNKS